MAEFPDLGFHCDLESCKKLDYTPFICRGCEKVFCSDHRIFHGCPKENGVTIENPTINKLPGFLCSKSGCLNSHPTKFECSLCDNNFCMEHRVCENHDCKGLEKEKKERTQIQTNSNIWISAKKKHVDPAQQARADKIAIMRLKAQSKSDIASIILFVNTESDRFPVMVPKAWSVNRGRTLFMEKAKTTNSDLKVYAQKGEEFEPIALDLNVNNVFKEMEEVYLMP